MRKILSAVTVLFGVTLAALPARADIAVGAGVGTLGYGVHASMEVNSFLALRANANFGNFDLPGLGGLVSSGLGGIDYNIGTSMSSYGLIADFHPLGISPIGDGIVLSGGMYYNNNEFDLTATAPAGTVVGGYTLLSSTSIITNMSFSKKFAPYAAIGYDGTFHTALPISFFATAGVLFQGGPSVSITTDNVLIPQADLDAEAAQIEADASNFEYYPVIAAGITIRF